jgi:hypothetical protein
MIVARKWEGLTFMEQLNRAAGRSIVGIGQAVAVETKRVCHVGVSGNLRRSVHCAPPSADHSGDEDASQSQDMMLAVGTVHAEEDPNGLGVGPSVEVGSWLDYACVEWVGRGHPGVTQGLEAVRGARADLIVAQAFREERL